MQSVSLCSLDYVKLDENELSFLYMISRLEVHITRIFCISVLFCFCCLRHLTLRDVNKPLQTLKFGRMKIKPCLTFLKNFVASREKKESNKNELRTLASSIAPDFIKVVQNIFNLQFFRNQAES